MPGEYPPSRAFRPVSTVNTSSSAHLRRRAYKTSPFSALISGHRVCTNYTPPCGASVCTQLIKILYAAHARTMRVKTSSPPPPPPPTVDRRRIAHT